MMTTMMTAMMMMTMTMMMVQDLKKNVMILNLKRLHGIGTGPTHSRCKYPGLDCVFSHRKLPSPNFLSLSHTFRFHFFGMVLLIILIISIITLCRVRKEDRGRFLCVARNKVGNATGQALLKVKCKSPLRYLIS